MFSDRRMILGALVVLIGMLVFALASPFSPFAQSTEDHEYGAYEREHEAEMREHEAEAREHEAEAREHEAEAREARAASFGHHRKGLLRHADDAS